MRILGIDPGIRNTGWGVVARDGARLVHLANGVIQPNPKMPDAERLAVIATGLPLLSGGPRRLAHGVFSTLTKREAKLPEAPTLPDAL